MAFGCFLGCAAVISQNSEFEVMSSTGCRALEVGENAFELNGHDGVLLVLDLKSIFENRFREGYKDDIDGEKCLTRMEKRLNGTLSNFRDKVILYHESNNMLNVYLNNPALMEKRSAGGVAIALSILDLVLTGVSYVYTDYRLNALKERILELDEQVNGLLSEQNVVANNQNFLYNEGKLLGIQKKMIVDHINGIEKVHTCDLLFMDFENKILRLEMYLDRILDGIIENKLTNEMIDFNTLELMTLDERFYQTIYRVAPMHLYKLSKIYLHSYTSNRITFVLSFPIINRRFAFKTVNVLETSESLLHGPGNSRRNFRFLIPKDAELNVTDLKVSTFRNADACLDIDGIVACQRDAILSEYSLDCLKKLLEGNVSRTCFGREKQGNVLLAYGKHGVLVHTRSKGEVINSETYDFVENLEKNSCSYIPKAENLVLRTKGLKLDLFREQLVWGSKWSMDAEDEKAFVNRIRNLSLPESSNPIVYNDTSYVLSKKYILVALSKLSNPWTAATVIAIALSIPVTCVMLFCCVSKLCKFTGSNVNVNVGARGIDGGMLVNH